MMPTTILHPLEATIDSALAWVERNLRFYDPVRGPSDPELRFKAFMELLFLVVPLLRSARSSPATRAVVAFAGDAVAGFDWNGALATDPARTLFCCAVALDFTNVTGTSFPLTGARLRALADDGVTDDLERVPYRRLDRAYSFHRAGLSGEPDYRALFGATALGTATSSPVFSRHDLYGITHTLFYVTDMGFRDARLTLTAAELARARHAVRLGTAVARADRDPDILGEMLLCWAALGMPEDELSAAGWRFVMDWQLADGSVPPPASYGRRLMDDPHEQARVDWEYRYHTTMVTALAGVTWRRTYAAS